MTLPDAARAAFADQAEHCRALDSPFMGRLNDLLATRPWPAGPVRDRVAAWPGEIGARGHAVPLRLCGALHALALSGDPLARAYPPHAVPDDALWSAVADALTRRAEFVERILDGPPQTNEVRRAGALIAAGHWIAARFGLPLVLSELGASAGLNLNWDRFALAGPGWSRGPDAPALTLRPDWTGPPPPDFRPRVAARRGVDLAPIDPTSGDGAARLRAYLWADQPHRVALTDAAIAVAGRDVDRGDAIDWLARRLDPIPGHVRMIQHTIAWQYFPPQAQARGTDLIEAAGARATPDAPLAWVGMEGDDRTPGAAIRLRLWPGALDLTLGRIDFHGRWISWAGHDPDRSTP
ncbi:MAG: DUF2332 domain-containing protein [Paracoccaceae bacterium]